MVLLILRRFSHFMRFSRRLLDDRSKSIASRDLVQLDCAEHIKSICAETVRLIEGVIY